MNNIFKIICLFILISGFISCASNTPISLPNDVYRYNIYIAKPDINNKNIISIDLSFFTIPVDKEYGWVRLYDVDKILLNQKLTDLHEGYPFVSFTSRLYLVLENPYGKDKIELIIDSGGYVNTQKGKSYTGIPNAYWDKLINKYFPY